MKVAVDTNVLVSAVIADGPPRRVLEVIADGAADLVLPAPVRVELRRVLRDQLALAEGAIEAILDLLDERALDVADVPNRVDALSGDANDDRILAAAVAADADVLISGDSKHLLPLGRRETMRIIRPQAFLAEIAGSR